MAEDKKNQRNMIFKFLRNKNGSKRGVVVAVCNDANYAIGVSCANIPAGDDFDRKQGMEMAEGRAWKALKLSGDAKKITERAAYLLKKKPSALGEREISTLLVDVEVPGSVVDQVNRFNASAARYFKGRTCVVNLNAPWSQLKKGSFEDDAQKLIAIFNERDMEDKNRFTPPSLRPQARVQVQASPGNLVEALTPKSFEQLASDLAMRVDAGEFKNMLPPKPLKVRKNAKKVLAKKKRK